MKTIATYVVLVYGFLLIAGGLIGFLKAQSKASLIAGGVSGILILICGFLMLSALAWATYLAIVITFLLTVVFAMRFAKTRSFMPSGMMLVLNEITFIILILSLVL
jgi:uncharacterized membrane protein (UPF0136 family)